MSFENNSVSIGSAESSDENSGNRSEVDRNKRNDTSSKRRFFRVALGGPGGNQRDRRLEMLVQHQEQERLKKQAEADAEKDKDDKDEEDDKKESSKSDDVSAEPKATEAADTIISDDRWAQKSDVPDEAFETFTASETDAKTRSEASELRDIPHIDADKPAAPLGFEEILAREMPPEFIEAASSPKQGASSAGRIAKIPDDQRLVDSMFKEMVSENTWPETMEWPKDSKHASVSEGRDTDWKDFPPMPSPGAPVVGRPPGPVEAVPSWRPTSPSAPFEVGVYGPPSAGPELTAPMPAPSGGGEASAGSGITAAIEALRAASGIADMIETIRNPDRLATRVLTEVALRGFLDQRKQERYRNEPLLHRQQEELTRMQEQQRQANERITAHFQREALQAQAAAGPEQQIVNQLGDRIKLEPGQHIERAPGGYSVVVGEDKKVAEGVIDYGDAARADLRRERLSDDMFAPFGAIGSSGGQDDNGLAQLPSVTGQSPYTQGQHALPPGYEDQVDLDHRLPEPRNTTIRDVALNPWLWLIVALLIIVYFVAALA